MGGPGFRRFGLTGPGHHKRSGGNLRGPGFVSPTDMGLLQELPGTRRDSPGHDDIRATGIAG